MFRNGGWILSGVLGVLLVACLPEHDRLPVVLTPPVLFFDNLDVVKDGLHDYTEAIHLRWTYPDSLLPEVKSFTLLRKLPEDSIVDVFSASRLIPVTANEFYDVLIGYQFPQNITDSIVYRIFAVDSAGRSGDTSDACRIVCAPQPTLVAIDFAKGCCTWESWGRGGVFSWCRIWDDYNIDWTGERLLEFPLTDQSARFASCIPDSFLPVKSGKLFYALYLATGDIQSLITGVANVP